MITVQKPQNRHKEEDGGDTARKSIRIMQPVDVPVMCIGESELCIIDIKFVSFGHYSVKFGFLEAL